MIITGKSLHRRTFLRGMGAAVALPFLDAMTPAMASPARTLGEPACRLAFVYVPNGIIMKDWVPASEGAGFELTRIMQPLAPYREQMLVMSGLAHVNGRALGDGPGDHARAASTFLTGVHPKKTEGSDIHLGVSVDQVAAQELGAATQFASLELGLESSGMVGNCDSGYSCAYSNSIAWRSPTTPLPPEINPRAVFERAVRRRRHPQTRRRARCRRGKDRGILDFVRRRGAAAGSWARGDRRESWASIWTRCATSNGGFKKVEASLATGAALPAVEKPGGIPVTFEEHAKLMFDLQVIAFQADLTRVITFMIGREGSNRTYRSIGVPDAHHGISHHQYNTEKIEKLTKINVHHVEMLAYFLGKLQGAQDGAGTLLDHSMVVYGSRLSRRESASASRSAGGGGGRRRGQVARRPGA